MGMFPSVGGQSANYNRETLMKSAPTGPLLDTPPAKNRFRGRLLTWYFRNRRDLPWRKNQDPYRVWVSEIMLQQTRVVAVLEHYQKFLRRFPTVRKLATARENSVLAAWSGLGYYRRARMLHAAAKEIVRKHDGKFPVSVAGWRELPGIGRYTAAAIASIAFNESVAVVDGNVERVLQRVSGKVLAGEKLWQAAEGLLDCHRPGDFNQAMMELGATVCLPRQPMCLACPVANFCATRGELKSEKKSSRQHKKEIYYALARRNGSVFMVQRPKDAAQMPRMWELPEVSNTNGAHKTWLTLRHSITLTDYTVNVLRNTPIDGLAGQWVLQSRLNKLPLTGLARKILRTAEMI